MVRMPGKRVSVAEAVRFLAARLPALREVHPTGDQLTEDEKLAVKCGLAATVAADVDGSLLDNVMALRWCLAWEVPTTKGERARLLIPGPRVTAVKVEAIDKLPPGAKVARFIGRDAALKLQAKSQTRPRGGRPSKHSARAILRKVRDIVEHHTDDHAPRAVAFVLWLLGCEVVEARDGETSAKYIERTTRSVEKLTRER